MEDDEEAWRHMLVQYLQEHILPLLDTYHQSLNELASSIEDELTSLCRNACAHSTCQPRLPTECDLLSVKMLLDKFSTSFRAEITMNNCGCCSSQIESSFECLSGVEHRYEALQRLPAVMMGVLKPGTCGMSLVDTTGQVDCELSTASCSLDVVGCLAILVQWNWIHTQSSGSRSKQRGYLEVEQLISIPSKVDAVTLPSDRELLSIAKLKDCMKRKELPARVPLCVYGRVRAVSETFRHGKSLIFLVELEDPLHSHLTHSVLNQVVDLLHLSSMLKVSEVYVFTDLRDKVLNKGLPNEHRVLVATDSTRVHPHTSLEDSQPPRKKTRVTESSQLFEDSQSCLSGQRRSLQENMMLEEQGLFSYTGVITSCILPEAGVYELDGRIRLYFSHQTCLHLCRGLRVGTSIELHNVHILKITAAHLKHLSGFYCCPTSTVRVAHFTQLNSPFQMYERTNLLSVLLRKYMAMDAAWLVHIYFELRNRQFGARTCHSLLQGISQSLSLTPLKSTDIFAEFLGHPHSCQLLRETDLTCVPLLPCVADVLREVSAAVESDDFTWEFGSSEDLAVSDNSALTYAASTRWSYGFIRGSQLHCRQFLVGELRGNKESGHMELVDSTGSIPVACTQTHCTHSSDHLTGLADNVLSGFGSIVLISDFDIVAEKTEKLGSEDHTSTSDTQLYVNARQLFACSQIKGTSAALSRQSSSVNPLSMVGTSTSPTAGHQDSPSKLIVKVINKNEVHTEVKSGPHSLSFTAHAYLSTDDPSSSEVHIALSFSPPVFGMYSFISNGCVYELTQCSVDTAALPLLEELLTKPIIEVSENMSFRFIRGCSLDSIQDVVEVISDSLLPPVPTVMNKEDARSSPSGSEKVVTLRGTILTRGHRINHESLPSSLPASTLSSIAVFTVQSLTYPDTIMVYCKCANLQTLTLGLVPGSVATFHSFTLTTSRSSNIYCVNSPSSSITVNSLERVERLRNERSTRSGIAQAMIHLPTVFISELMKSLLSGCLSKRMVCIRSRIVTVQRVNLQYKCRGCQCVSVNGQCMVACLRRSPSLIVDGRLIIDDGSGEAHVYYTGEGLFRELLMVPTPDWKNLRDLVMTIGTVTFIKASSTFKQVGNTSSASSSSICPLTEAQNQLSDIATNPVVQRSIKLYCQPFMSQTELKECVLGQKSRTVYLRQDQQYTTLVLPKLQLKAVACVPLDGLGYVSECRKLLNSMSVS